MLEEGILSMAERASEPVEPTTVNLALIRLKLLEQPIAQDIFEVPAHVLRVCSTSSFLVVEVLL